MFEIFAYKEMAYAVRESAMSVLMLNSAALSLRLMAVAAIFVMFWRLMSMFLEIDSVC